MSDILVEFLCRIDMYLEFDEGGGEVKNMELVPYMYVEIC